MSAEIFKKFFYDPFILKVEKSLESKMWKGKSSLLFDNASCHMDKEKLMREEIKAFFFKSPHVTLLLQPLDRVVL